MSSIQVPHELPARLVLRSTTLRRRAQFPFQNLPAELRNIIYDLVLNYDSVDKYFASYTREMQCGVSRVNAKGHRLPPKVKTAVPTILLLNREIYNEAVGVLRSKPLLLTHGLFKANLKSVIAPDTLRQVTHLVLTDHVGGVDIMEERLAPWCFSGLARLCMQLVDVLKGGHSLKKLEFHFNKASLQQHVERCWQLDRGCDMRRWLQGIASHLRLVHGIDKVIITGYMPESLKADLGQTLQAPRCPLLRLPLDVRAKIFGMAADWNEGPARLQQDNINLVSSVNGKFVTMTTPTVLLLNRQFAVEALEVLHKTPLVIYCQHTAWGHEIRSAMTQYISASTLQKVTDLTIALYHWDWLDGLKDVFRLLQQGHSLQCFHLHLDDMHAADIVHAGHCYPDRQVAEAMVPITKIRGIPHVTITGNLPACYTDSLVEMMQAPAGSGNLPLYAASKSRMIEELPVFTSVSESDG